MTALLYRDAPGQFSSWGLSAPVANRRGGKSVFLLAPDASSPSAHPLLQLAGDGDEPMRLLRGHAAGGKNLDLVVEEGGLAGTLEVPARFRNPTTQLMREIGNGEGYRYAHDEPGAYAAGERYLPDEMPDRRYYSPAPRGLEIQISESLARRRTLDREAGAKPAPGSKDSGRKQP